MTDAPRPGPPPGATADLTSGLSALSGLEERPVHEHVAVFEEVHRRLQDALQDASPDAPQGSSPGPR